MPPRSLLLAALVALGSLACGGLLDGDGPSFEQEAALDAEDKAEILRKQGDFAGAEALLNERLTADPSDFRSRRLLGDVNFTRGQRFAQRWKENLAWAREAYGQALLGDPTSCLTWGRYAAAAVASAENETIAPTREEIDALPLDQGWESCPGSAMVEIEMLRKPSQEELDIVRRRLESSAPMGQILAEAAPWQVQAIQRMNLGQVEYQKLFVRPEPTASGSFVVLTLPTSAAGVDGAQPRRFTYPEWLTIRRISGDRITYLDRRFPERIPEQGVAKATGCPGTEWRLEPPDNVPAGQCRAGRFDARASEVYDPGKLRTAGVAYYHHPSIAPAQISWADIAEDSISCLGGPVGRMFVDTPSCKVAYDRAIPQMRSVPVSSGLAALNQDHAIQMVDLARSGAFYGEDLAAHLALGEVGVGLPYSVWSAAMTDLTGCKGRGVYQKTDFVDGATEFACTLGDVTYEFRELTLVEIKVGKP